jgi:cytochrome c
MKTTFVSALAGPWALLFACALSGCVGGQTARGYDVRTGGNPHKGAQLISQYGCGSCHTIPGIRSANGLVGPPLMMFGRRTYIAGELPNTPENLVHWIQSPQSVESGTAMPTLGVTQQQARDIAAYLYTLR